MLNSQKSFAKVNLDLQINDKIINWFHLISSIFHRISLYDILIFEEKNHWIEIKTVWRHIRVPTNSSNTCYKAADILKKRFKIWKWIRINIEKNIPLMSGLWWWSSNAAITLIYLNKAWNLNLKINELIEIWKQIWSDVPFFISEFNCAKVTWIWEKLKQKEPEFSWKYIALFQEKYIKINTKWAYDAFDKYNKLLKIPSNKIKNNNAFEWVIFNYFPDLNKIKKSFLYDGAIKASLTWSWSVIYWIFENKNFAKKAIKNIDLEWWNWIYEMF